MWWVLFGCMSESVDVQEPVVKNEVLSQGAETVIQHLQTQLGAENDTNGVQVWLTPSVDWVQPLATFLANNQFRMYQNSEMMRLWLFQLSKETQFRSST